MVGRSARGAAGSLVRSSGHHAGSSLREQPEDHAPRHPRPPRLVRVQVKGTLGRPGQPRRFRLKKGYRNTGLGQRAYAPGDFDLAAFVCLRDGAVLFSPVQEGEAVIAPGQVGLLRAVERDLFLAALHVVGALTEPEVALLEGRLAT